LANAMTLAFPFTGGSVAVGDPYALLFARARGIPPARHLSERNH
jgi:hypothetical protein